MGMRINPTLEPVLDTTYKDEMIIEAKENVKLKLELCELKAQLKEAIEVIGFYGDKFNYQKHENETGLHIVRINWCDEECFVENNELTGGKKAREFLSKLREE